MATKLPSFETPFDTYQADAIIGEGGVGRVYSVKNSSGETLALKCLAPERVSSERLKRFKNEITFSQKQDHANVLKVLDTGATIIKGVKCPFYVMRRYSGTLRSHIADITPAEALAVFSQVVDGVEAAHFAGVDHRDLKPENILWNKENDVFVVADFGVAHFKEEQLYTAVETKVAARLANFLYSAPEQRVRGMPVDRRADIFALGLMLNELFTKQVPQGAGFKRVRDVAPDHAYIDEIVEPMIQQNADNRPATLEAVKKELLGRKKGFVALQRYDAISKQTVAAAQPAQFEPIAVTDFDYNKGLLELTLSRNVLPGWAQEFSQPRGGYSSILGYGPERFQVRGNTITIGVRENAGFVQQLINHAKDYVAAANRGYLEQLREQAARREREQREALQREQAEAELKKSILTNVKL